MTSNTSINSEFAAINGHELRTPISQIATIARLLKEDLNDNFLSIEERADCLNDILASVETMDALTEELIRIATGKQKDNWEVQLTEVNLHKLLMQIHHTFAVQIPDAIEFKLSYHESLPKTVIGDSLRIQQCVANLVRNAIKFTEKGKIEILVDYADIENALKISVRDTGIGIDKEKLKSSWEAFTKVHDVKSEINEAQKSGLGLGLNIVKHFIFAMHGTVGVDSTLSRGTTFHFTLPIHAS